MKKLFIFFMAVAVSTFAFASSETPLAKSILKSVSKTKCIVTAEEHQRHGGLGDSVAQLLAQHQPTPQEYVAVNDSFGESGTPDELMTKYGLDTINIIEAVNKVMKRK